MLLRSRVYHHQLADLFAARYDMLKEPYAVISKQLQERILAPTDTHSSKARRTLEIETLNIRDRGLNKNLAAAQIKQVGTEGRRRGRRGRCGKGDGDPTAKKNRRGPWDTARPLRSQSWSSGQTKERRQARLSTVSASQRRSRRLAGDLSLPLGAARTELRLAAPVADATRPPQAA